MAERLTPPVLAEYQFIVPALAVADNETAPVPHRLPGVVEVTVGFAVTVIVGAPLTEAAKQPFASVTEVKPKVVVDAGVTTKSAALTELAVPPPLPV